LAGTNLFQSASQAARLPELIGNSALRLQSSGLFRSLSLKSMGSSLLLHRFASVFSALFVRRPLSNIRLHYLLNIARKMC
jgi:hypothetical protein